MGRAAYWRPYLLNRKRFSNLLRAESCQSPSESVYFLTLFFMAVQGNMNAAGLTLKMVNALRSTVSSQTLVWGRGQEPW
jgi:hypothetical protein